VIRRFLWGLALAWALVALLSETREALSGLDRRALAGTDERRYQFGTPRVDRLAATAEAVRTLVPAGSILAFASPEDAASFDRFRWTAYLLPEDQIVPLADPRSGEAASYLLTVRRPISHPRLELLRELPGAARLYRVRP
jgi:hypothetical protein